MGVVQESPSPDALTLQSEDQDRLRRLIQNLPHDAQELIAMKFGAGMTNRQIANVLGKSETAVGSALHRLVCKLRRKWEETS
jgi:RNA polymerase sigma-70 factor (ECF subfamily)